MGDTSFNQGSRHINLNQVFISGVCTYFKVFPADGKDYTSAWLKVKVNSDIFLCEIQLSTKDLQGKYLQIIESTLKVNTYVFVEGLLTNNKNKEAKNKIKINCKLRNVHVNTIEQSSFATAIIAGKIVNANSNVVTVETSYRNVSDNTYKSRFIPVSLPVVNIDSEYNSLHPLALDSIAVNKSCYIEGNLREMLPSKVSVYNVMPYKLIVFRNKNES